MPLHDTTGRTALRSGDVMVFRPKDRTVMVIRDGQPLSWNGHDDKRHIALLAQEGAPTGLVVFLGDVLGLFPKREPDKGDGCERYKFYET